MILLYYKKKKKKVNIFQKNLYEFTKISLND